jgi:peptidyl-prolyl cis-trans isomerase SurA
MRKIISVFISVLFIQIATAQKEPVVMEVNGKAVTKSEFLQIYLKNNNDPKFDKQTLDEYVEMFKKFKLKVFILYCFILYTC